MSSIPKVRRRRTMLMVGANVLVVAAMAGLLVWGGLALTRYQGAKNASERTIAVPKTPVGMLATVDADNALTSVTVFVMRPPMSTGTTVPGAFGQGGSILSVPISADILGGANGDREPLTEAYTTGGAEGLQLAVESLLSVTIDQAQVVDSSAAAKLLDPIAPITVDLPSDVKYTRNGVTATLYPKGEASLSGAQAVAVIDARVEGRTALSHQPAIEAVWRGVAAAVGQGVSAEAIGSAPGTFPQLLQQVFAGPVQAQGLPALVLASSDRPAGMDVCQLDRSEAVMRLATVAPSNMSAVATGLNFRVEAPPGHEAKVKAVVAALLYLGSNVQQVYLDGPVQDATVVYLYDERFQGDVAGIETLFGTNLETRSPERKIDGIDIVIQLGGSYLDSTTPDTLPSTTTTTTVP